MTNLRRTVPDATMHEMDQLVMEIIPWPGRASKWAPRQG
jgi:hypothetical protein